jgi:cell division protein FtsA
MFKFIKNKSKKAVISIVDLGSTKIVCLVAEVLDGGELNIIGIGHQASEGFKAGAIIDKAKAEQSIIAAIDDAERMSGARIDNVVIVFSGNNLQSHPIRTEMAISAGKVIDKDIGNIIRNTLERFDRNKLEIIHYFPLSYSIDDTDGIKDPKGMFGSTLSCNLNVITAATTPILNIANSIANCHLNMNFCIASPLASATACLTDDEKDIGTTIFDLGGQNTSIATFHEGKLIYLDSMPFGGNHITSDIAKELSIDIASAERIKTLHGSLLSSFADNHKVIELNQVGEEHSVEHSFTVTNKTLNAIITARAEEIIEFAHNRLKNTLDPSLYRRIALTGGASQLVGTKEMVSNIFGSKTRLATPEAIPGFNKIENLPGFASALGGLLYMAQLLQRKKETENLTNKKLSSQFMDWVKENL